MRILDRHSTVYRYQIPVSLEPHVFRLRPRVYGAQRLLAYELEIQPVPAGQTEYLDQDGNVALHAWFGAPAREWRVLSSFDVETLREDPFDFLLRSELGLPLLYPEPLRPVLAAYAESTQLPASIKEFACGSSGCGLAEPVIPRSGEPAPL